MTPSLISRPFLLLLTQFFAVSTVVALFFPLQEYLRHLGVADSSIGFIIGADALAALVVQVLITPFVTARTARRWLLAGALLLALALLLEGSVTDVGLFTVARLLQGAGFICVVAALMPLFVLCIPREMSGRAFGLISLVRLAPYAAVPPMFDLFQISPVALGSVLQWSSLLALAAAGLLLLLPVFEQERQAAVGASFSGMRQSLGSPAILLLLGATALLYAGYATAFFFMKGFVSSAGLTGGGAFFTIATLVMMVVRLVGGSCFDRFDKRLLNSGSLLLAAVATALLPWVASDAALLVVAVMCGLGWGVAMPLLNALIFDRSPAELRGLNQNLSLIMLQAGFFAGPWAGGALLAGGGYRLLFAGSGSLLLLAGLACLLIRKADDRPD